jgi:hypothetical protein
MTELELVIVATARSPQVAQVIASLLREAKVPAYVAGTLLQDEWAASQKLLGTLSSDIQVRKQDVERAKKVLDAAREAGRELDKD